MAHTGEVRALWILVVAMGCSDAPAPVTADAAVDAAPLPPFHFWLGVIPYWPAGVPEPATPPTVYIDSVARERFEIDYANVEEAIGQQHVVELRYDALVVASYSIPIQRRYNCLERDPYSSEFSVALCAVPSGELRYAGEGTTSCSGDAFCGPRCRLDWGCRPGSRCTSIFASLDPIATHLGCAPIGVRGLGETCSLVTSYAGIHDNCGAQLVCVAGTCKHACGGNIQVPQGCTSCTYVPGHAPEVYACN